MALEVDGGPRRSGEATVGAGKVTSHPSKLVDDSTVAGMGVAAVVGSKTATWDG